MDALVNTELEEGEIDVSEKGPEDNVIMDALVNTELEEGEIDVSEKGPEDNVIMDALVNTELEEGEIDVSEKGAGDDDKVQDGVNCPSEMAQIGKKSVLQLDYLRGAVAEEGDVKSTPIRYLKNVYLREGVEVIRDFPPYCGGNAPMPTEEELLRINGNKVFEMGDEDSVVVGNWRLKDATDRGLKRRPFDDAGGGLGYELKDKVPAGRQMRIPYFLWGNGKRGIKKEKKHALFPEQHMTKDRKVSHGVQSLQRKVLSAGKAAYQGAQGTFVKNEYDHIANDEEQNDDSEGPCFISVALPPFGPKNSSDARNRVRETRQLFQAACRKLLQGEEAKLRPGEDLKSHKPKSLRIDLVAADYIKKLGKEVNNSQKILGAVPGVEVGDEFQYRTELAIVGVHRLYQGGIDYMKYDRDIVATSIVASGGYDDELGNSDVLIYSGQGGNLGVVDTHKPAEDQKLERGNLALKNSIDAKTPVRVIRGSKEIKASKSVVARAKIAMSYVYDGLYIVEGYKQVPGPRDKLVFKFELRRIPGQPELSWNKVYKVKKQKRREGLCVIDISGGKESIPICAINTIDDEKPPTFNYIVKMTYSDQYNPALPEGCNCNQSCWDFGNCSCAFKNGGEFPIIPYNHNGAIVETRSLVYECGPSCRCPSSCCNRVTQHGIKILLEIFKTKSKGWGVRSLNFIPSGTFICEYTGELLEDREAENRVGFDEYLFDIGQNYKDCCSNHDEKTSCSIVAEKDAGFCIDAFRFGNIGRFINHSCSPNLYAQNVLYDHEDKRVPHIMLFAVENIPPLQELTYHYNYAVGTVHDFNGNVKKKSCYCGSTQCTGRLY